MCIHRKNVEMIFMRLSRRLWKAGIMWDFHLLDQTFLYCLKFFTTNMHAIYNQIEKSISEKILRIQLKHLFSFILNYSGF